MKKYGLNELRELFLSFFEEKGHLRLPSYPLIPQDDPSLLLINSGMAPMKTWFTGEVKPPSTRICTCQKCIRTGDIENVGKTSRHGTYFEMLGNFSFGDYFKREAIGWCWEFLTERLGLPSEHLYPSVYLEDDEAFAIWRDEIGIAPDRIAKLGKADNFWEHGAGPCGPCSEVYFDRGEAAGCDSPDCAPGCDCDRFVEIWNNVFTQFENDGEGNYTELSQKNIDTGMGLERLAVVCQGVNNLFEVDTVMSIIRKVSELSGVAYGTSAKSDVSIRVITDHIRSGTMMISDGVMPSNEGRGYVLRRLLRRAARHGRLLGIDGTFLHDLCLTVIDANKDAYPALNENADYITRIIRVEEENFGKTIDAGTAMLSGLIADYKEKGATVLSGEDAFKLYDTYGFPLDLTIEILEEHGLGVDAESFNEHMEQQRVRARAARSQDSSWAGDESKRDYPPTEFLGYVDTHCVATILDINEDQTVIILDESPFYAESGGQSSDFGTITLGGAVFDVDNVQQSRSGTYLHHGKMREGLLNVGDQVTAQVNLSRRNAIMRAHTATHLLHKALRAVLGSHVGQSGSLVEPDRIRFDFTHIEALTKDELNDIERLVNDAILDGLTVSCDEMPLEMAKSIGATALFGEKYGDTVRVVKMGDVSIELCGGIHLDNTAKVGAFCITAEFSTASGIRRIEALCGKETLKSLKTANAQLAELAGLVKAGANEEIAGKVSQNLSELREAQKMLTAMAAKESHGEAGKLLGEAKNVDGLKIITAKVASPDALKQMADSLRDSEPAIVAVLAAVKDGKVTIAAACGKTAVERGIKAGDMIREVTKLCDGSGGGKPDFAMGGGKDPAKVRSALDAVESIVRSKL